MPLLRYFGWVGSLLLAALFATSWWFTAPTAPASLSDVPLDQKVFIRIHSDHKWPERVVLDTTHSTLAQDAKASGETDIGGSETAVPAECQCFEAFAEMTRTCFQTTCSTQRAERDSSPIEKGPSFQRRSRLSMMARRAFTLPSQTHKPPGRSRRVRARSRATRFVALWLPPPSEPASSSAAR